MLSWPERAQLSFPVRQGVPAVRIPRAAVELTVSSVSWHGPPATVWKDYCSFNPLSAYRPLSNVIYMLLVRLPILDSSLDAQDLITRRLGVRTVVKYRPRKFAAIDHGHSGHSGASSLSNREKSVTIYLSYCGLQCSV